jgi:hypothetical protein
MCAEAIQLCRELLLGCAAVLLTMTPVAAEPKPIVVLASWNNLEKPKYACDNVTSNDMKVIAQVLNNPSDYNPEDVKYNKQLFDGILECKSVKDTRELGRRLESAS